MPWEHSALIQSGRLAAEEVKASIGPSRVFRMVLPPVNCAIRLKVMKKTINETEIRPKATLRKRSRSTSGMVMAWAVRATSLIRLPSSPITQIGTTM